MADYKKITIKAPTKMVDDFSESVANKEGSKYFRTKVLKKFMREYSENNKPK
jgi:hypothetical protein